jgi:S-adenosylmethionine-diacylglycerol 3-amino-3-carboxypropyl transferase
MTIGRKSVTAPVTMSSTEIQSRADFSALRYAQCWEDADVLVAALEPNGRDCLSIGSAGDNCFALLARGANSVTAVEMNPAQVACIELRRAAYLHLEHEEYLELLGSRPCADRLAHYRKLRAHLPAAVRQVWDNGQAWARDGLGAAGKFEHYFRLFREWVLPLAHPRARVDALLASKTRAEREQFYQQQWNNRRWRVIFKVFFSRWLMGRLGRDPEFFKYVDGKVAERILDRARHALCELDPAQNPYLHWILRGTHGEVLPMALRRECFAPIRQAVAENRLRVVTASIEALVEAEPERMYDAFNLSDIFEYMSETAFRELLEKVVAVARQGARLAYWNMLAPRSRPAALAPRLQPLEELAASLLREDRAFFYARFVVEEVRG